MSQMSLSSTAVVVGMKKKERRFAQHLTEATSRLAGEKSVARESFDHLQIGKFSWLARA